MKTPNARLADGAGLYARTDRRGNVRFLFQFTQGGRRREIGLGAYPEMTLQAARKRHTALQAELVAGHNPTPPKRATGGSPGQQSMFDAVLADYIEVNEPGWRSERYAQYWGRAVRKHGRSLLKMDVSDITIEHVLAVLQPIWLKHPDVAKRVRSRVELIIEAARARGMLPHDAQNPADLKMLRHWLPAQSKIAHHFDAMPWRVMPAFIIRLGEEGGLSALALEFTILTAARTGEVRGAMWAEIDLEAAVWVIPAERMKMTRPHRVPLSDRAVEILRTIAAASRGDGWIFPGRLSGKPMAPDRMLALMRRMGLQHDVHSFRSAFRDWAAEHGVAFEAAELALAHDVGSAVVRAYHRADLLEQRRPIMQAWADFLLGEQAGDNVVPLRMS